MDIFFIFVIFVIIATFIIRGISFIISGKKNIKSKKRYDYDLDDEEDSSDFDDLNELSTNPMYSVLPCNIFHDDNDW